MNQTGHRSVTTVRRYIRDGNLFRENARAEECRDVLSDNLQLQNFSNALFNSVQVFSRQLSKAVIESLLSDRPNLIRDGDHVPAVAPHGHQQRITRRG